MTHLEILIEDISGKTALENLLPKFLPPEVTYDIHEYRGIGRLPLNLRTIQDPAKRALLDQLPRIISGYGKAFLNDPEAYQRYVIVICDLDNRNPEIFLRELNAVVQNCRPAPRVLFLLAVEEGEAWLLGDKDAVVAAYPRCKQAELNSYVPDSICGTWEKTADILTPGGAKALKRFGYRAIGVKKTEWASSITPNIVIERNASPSFQAMVREIAALLG